MGSQTTISVAVVVSGTESFGVESFLLSQLAHAAEHGLHFTYLSLEDGPLARSLRLRGADVTVVGGSIPSRYPLSPLLLPFLWLRFGRRLVAAYRGIREQLHAIRPHVVYSHSYYTHVLCALAARRLYCRRVAQIHWILNRRRLFGLQHAVLSVLLPASADAIVVISTAALRSLTPRARRKASLCYNGVDMKAVRSHSRKARTSRRRLVIVGRLVSWKRQDVAIRAMRLLADANIACSLDIVGGPIDDSNLHYRRLRNLVSELGLTDRVAFPGVVSPPYGYMASADALLSCAEREPFGLVVIEAVACRTPVIVADTGGTRELVTHNETGLLYRAGDPAALAVAVRRLFLDPQLPSRLAHDAWENALHRFDIAVHMDRLRGIFETTLAEQDATK